MPEIDQCITYTGIWILRVMTCVTPGRVVVILGRSWEEPEIGPNSGFQVWAFLTKASKGPWEHVGIVRGLHGSLFGNVWEAAL